MTTPDPDRARDLIHMAIAIAQLHLDEPTFRAMVSRLTAGRTDSRAYMTPPERAAFLAECKAAGWRPAPPKRRRPRPGEPAPERMQALHTKVRALLTDQRKPWSYAEAILRRQRGITDPAIACPLAQATDPELRGVITALARQGKRSRRRPTTGDAA